MSSVFDETLDLLYILLVLYFPLVEKYKIVVTDSG